ncbi:MAG: ribonuclease H-like domain-containing protein [Syntrophorhabdaceae bacterium]|nr:ribonuclease H-like domain-containing protein [Syntrophorhabdaceae bacterium]
MKAYLDIETDRKGRISVIGVYTEKRGLTQLYGEDVTIQNLQSIIEQMDTIVTFNGDLFDLPVIKKCLNLDLKMSHLSIDLCKEKRKLGIKGGLKELEKMFGISRKTEGINGYMAIKLWEDYRRNGTQESLDLLLEYNAEDVINLLSLERYIAILKERWNDR